MMSDTITETREVDAPTDRLWSALSDVRRLPEVLSGMTSLRVEGEDPSMRVGLTWVQTRVIRGHTGSERLRVSRVDPGAGYVTEGGSHGFAYVTTWAIEPIGSDRSRVTCSFRGIPQTWFARLLMRLFGRSGDAASRDAIRTDLRDLAAATASDAR